MTKKGKEILRQLQVGTGNGQENDVDRMKKVRNITATPRCIKFRNENIIVLHYR